MISNVRPTQLKTCIVEEWDCFVRIIKLCLGENVTVEATLEGIDIYDDDRDITSEEINDALSKYYGVTVTSVHIDDCDTILAWICYKEDSNNKAKEEND